MIGINLQVLHGHANTMDRFVRKIPSLVGPFCCIFCWKVEEDLDHILWRCDLASIIWESFLQMFGMMYARHKHVSAMIEEFLFNPPFGERPFFMACRSVSDFMGFVGGVEQKGVIGAWKGSFGDLVPCPFSCILVGFDFKDLL